MWWVWFGVDTHERARDYAQILRHDDPMDRARVIVLLIHAVEVCLQYNNYDSATGIMGMLAESSVHRLKKTWVEVEKTIPKHYEAMKHAVGLAGRGLESTLNQLMSEPPYMPLMGYIFKVLINQGEIDSFIESESTASKKLSPARAHKPKPPPPPPPSGPAPPNAGKAKRRPKPPPPPPPALKLINFDRIRKIAHTIDVVRCSQQVREGMRDACTG